MTAATVENEGGSLLLERITTLLKEGLTVRRLVKTGVAVAVTLVAVYAVLPHVLHPQDHPWQTPNGVLVKGLNQGLTYGLLAVGLVLIYRTNRVINFAHGQIGAFGAAFFVVETHKWHMPYYVAFLPALAMAGATGAIAEAAVVRRLRKAPAIMSVVATLGVGQFLLLLGAFITSQSGSAQGFPSPPGLPEFSVGAYLVTPASSAELIFSPFLVVAIGLFLKFSRYGLGIRASAANPEAARMTGIFASRMSSIAWALAGALAAFGAILTSADAHQSSDAFGPGLLLIALTAAVIGRMQSMPVAMAAGIGIGLISSLVSFNYGQDGLVQLVLFFIILGALILQRQRVGRSEEKGSWAAVQSARPLPLAIRQVPAVRALGPLSAVLFFGLFGLLPFVISNEKSISVTEMFAFIIVGLSVGIVSGLGGQLSLGQFGIAAVGAWVSFEVSRRTGNFVESFVYAGLASAAISVVIGIPALKVKGLLLTVTTLAFALVMPAYILQRSWVFGGGVNPGQPIVHGHVIETGRDYYWFGLLILLVALLIARNVRAGGLGRRLLAVRDNEDAARAFTVPASVVKVQGFALAGFLAGLGGAMFGHSVTSINPTYTFPIASSITVVVMTVIGGIGILSGPFLGAGVVFGIPLVVTFGAAGLAGTALFQLLLIMYLPAGLGGVITPFRDRIANSLARRAGVDVEAAYMAERGFNATGTGSGVAPALTVPRQRRHQGNGTLLQATLIRKSFGGVRAVRGVSFEVRSGETLGLIGPNGAGKTTTFELLAGFTKVDQGTVTYGGRDITGLGPEARGRLGLIRSFQDAALFPTLTVIECVQLSLERVAPTTLLPSLLGLRGAEKKKLQKAEELIAWMGLERYRSSQIQELSTGTRRITEIACLVALQPQLLLLDEPSSGVAQKETEALGRLLVRLKAELGLTLIIIEHDIPLIMELSDRIVCMADGEVIAQGTPDVVRNDPAVVEAYLGGSITAIERSAGAHGTPAAQPVTTPTKPTKPTTPTTPAAQALTGVVPGLGATREAALLAAFGSVEAVLTAPLHELTAVHGIGPGMAARIHDSLSHGRAR